MNLLKVVYRDNEVIAVAEDLHLYIDAIKTLRYLHPSKSCERLKRTAIDKEIDKVQ